VVDIELAPSGNGIRWKMVVKVSESLLVEKK
jgi:hypothetical protein